MVENERHTYIYTRTQLMNTPDVHNVHLLYINCICQASLFHVKLRQLQFTFSCKKLLHFVPCVYLGNISSVTTSISSLSIILTATTWSNGQKCLPRKYFLGNHSISSLSMVKRSNMLT